MTKFLTIKHWQLFALLVGTPILIIAINSFTGTLDGNILFAAFPIMMILFIVILFGWLYSLGTNLYKKLPQNVTMNLTRFKVFIIVPVAYMLSISIFILCVLFNVSFDGKPNPVIFALIIPLHLFSIFCIFYCFYFNAKALATVELQRTVTFSEFIAEFFLIWFFALGVWIIQPRINKLFNSEGN